MRTRSETVDGWFGLRHLRRAVGMTQEEVADYMGVAMTTVSSWEREARAPTLEKQRIVLNHLKAQLPY